MLRVAILRLLISPNDCISFSTSLFLARYEMCFRYIHIFDIFRVTHILIYKWMYFSRYVELKKNARGLKEISNKIFRDHSGFAVIRSVDWQ